MAIKDWKKRYEDKYTLIFNSVMGQIKIDKKLPDYKPIFYEVEYSYGHFSANSYKQFKSKAQALKFAKSYMRTH